MSRRNFLKLCSLAGLGFASPIGMSSLLRAKEPDNSVGYEGPFYVVFNASGGWDTTYLMDPKGVEGINRLYKEGDIVTTGPHRLAPTAKHIEKGMSNEEFFTKYGSELRVLNGLDFSVNNHSPCARYMATGKLDLNSPNSIGRLAVFAGVRDLPTRVKCAILPWHTLHAAFNSVASASTEAEQDPMHAPIGNA